ncbi:MAG: hypothetical protein LBU35_03265 [Holosporales bacterium]|jgi:hypothetical protein|nr:hypothetical protein [Holosporales bacterium]
MFLYQIFPDLIVSYDNRNEIIAKCQKLNIVDKNRELAIERFGTTQKRYEPKAKIITEKKV